MDSVAKFVVRGAILLAFCEPLEANDATVTRCTLRMEYTNCSCKATCEDPRNENECNNNCTNGESCICPDGLLMAGGKCARKENHGCYMEEEGIIENGGIYINSDCSKKCSCDQNQLICEETQCSVDATCKEKEGKRLCECNDGFVGDGQDCAVAATDCLDLYNSGITTDGVYSIHPTGWSKLGFEVRCEMESNGGGWTVFQRRVNGTEDFFRDWNSYKEGFGMLTHEFWLGNDKIYTLTHQGLYQLRIDVMTPQGTSIHSLFSFFRINDENDKYRLTLGTESGNPAGNPLQHNNGRPFSTYDQDNDNTNAYNCAYEHQGAWWYGYLSHIYYESHRFCWKWRVGNGWGYCGDANLNGGYHQGGTKSIFLWYSDDDPNRPECGITQTEMKIRPLREFS